MKKVSIQEFNQFYISEILPFIKPYENKRASYNKDFAPLKKVTLTIFFIMIACFVITIFITAFNAFVYTTNPQMGSMNNFHTLFSIGPIFIIGAIVIMFIFGNLTNDKHKNIKKELQYGLLCKIFSYCNSQISNNTTSEQITLSELQKTSLPIYSKTDDDTLCGYYKNVKFVINEAYAKLGIQSNKTGLFRVLILKLEMNKNFSGQTIVVPKYINYNARNKEEVILEDTNFMKLNNVYSTDQIEARYLLTPSFMERITSIGKIFAQKALSSQATPTQYKYYIQKNPTCITAFNDRYVYILINTAIDNFDIPLDKNMYNINIYYNIYLQLFELLSTIEYLKLNEKTGL